MTKDEFEPEIVENREIRDLIRKIHVSPDEDLSRQYPAHWGCRSEVEFSDGTVLENAVVCFSFCRTGWPLPLNFLMLETS